MQSSCRLLGKDCVGGAHEPPPVRAPSWVTTTAAWISSLRSIAGAPSSTRWVSSAVMLRAPARHLGRRDHDVEVPDAVLQRLLLGGALLVRESPGVPALTAAGGDTGQV